MSNDERLTWDLITGVLDVLEKHGYHHAGGRHSGRVIGLIGDLARIYEGTQEGPAMAYPPPVPEPGQAPSAEVVAVAGMSTILLALDQASDYRRERAACCADCEDQSCDTCQFRLEAAQAYDSLAARLQQARDAVTPDRPSRLPVHGCESGARSGQQGTAKRVSEMTDEEVRELATAPRATTYWQAQSDYRSIIEVGERFEELTTRELLARSYATLKARGTYDPHEHGDASKHHPLTATEHLEILALGEMLARYYRHPARIDEAVKAGASWSQVAEAVGSDEALARRAYREWADGQHRLHADYEGKFGMDDAEHAAAISRAFEPPARPETGHEAGQ